MHPYCCVAWCVTFTIFESADMPDWFAGRSLVCSVPASQTRVLDMRDGMRSALGVPKSHQLDWPVCDGDKKLLKSAGFPCNPVNVQKTEF
jgi:hypothetical protein